MTHAGRSSLLASSVATLVALAAGCALDQPPLQPSWQVDVMPVLAANCVRCHGFPVNVTAPFGLRLDSFANIEVAGHDGTFQGAAINATAIATLTRPSNRRPGKRAMPPQRQLDDDQVTVLRNWAGLVDGGGRAPRGAGRPDNASPVLTLTEVARDAATVTFAYELRDADRDLVVGTLRGPVVGAQGQLGVGVIGDLVAGRGTFVVDVTGVPAGVHALTARLDDGADIDGPDGTDDFIDVPAGALEVTP